ncbi:hypothetical protein TNCV_4440061, partial [Trichonephila clavipes]
MGVHYLQNCRGLVVYPQAPTLCLLCPTKQNAVFSARQDHGIAD